MDITFQIGSVCETFFEFVRGIIVSGNLRAVIAETTQPLGLHAHGYFTPF